MTSILNRNIFKKYQQPIRMWAVVDNYINYEENLIEMPERKILKAFPDIYNLTVTHYGKVLILGINLPDSSNLLNDSVLNKLNERLKDFNVNDQYSVAVLHGIGGNFCTGIQESADITKGEDLLMTMKELKKPTVASLTGTTKFFGFQLAMMCDVRIMESNALFGLGHRKERGYLHPAVRERLLQVAGLGTALEIALTNSPLNQYECFAAGLVNKWVDIGSGLGRTINLATAIAKFPLDEIIHERSLMYSCMKNISASA